MRRQDGLHVLEQWCRQPEGCHCFGWLAPVQDGWGICDDDDGDDMMMIRVVNGLVKDNIDMQTVSTAQPLKPLPVATRWGRNSHQSCTAPPRRAMRAHGAHPKTVSPGAAQS